MNVIMAPEYRAMVMLFAFIFGVCSYSIGRNIYENRKRHRLIHRQACLLEKAEGKPRQGFDSAILDFIRRNSLGRQHDVFYAAQKIPRIGKHARNRYGVWSNHFSMRNSLLQKIQRHIVEAGQESSTNIQGVLNASAALALFSAIIFGAVGLTISTAMAGFGFASGLAIGMLLPLQTLKREGEKRNQEMERGLSEFIDVICVGLHSGLTFDRSLSLYCKYFHTEFSDRLTWAHQAWSIGITTRKDALRHLALGYNSKILEQAFECVIRSATFGSPLAENLENFSIQARRNREAKSKEKAMKIPVKMMIPIGTLLLPSMLLLVLGPALLNLAHGL